MAEKLFECEWTPGEELVFRFRRPGLRLLAPEVRTHLLGARKETLLAVRSLLDTALERLQEEERPRRRRRRAIKVE
jgi:hypothetical protein